ncbi:MAG: peptidoglycan-binding protein [Acidobacteria bacterium]|nr:MAG: peptidoglycan-binding protein [Acidobacteriota bacterium]
MPFVLLAVMFLSSYAAVAAQASEEMSREEIRKAQQALKLEGFDPGPLDGIIGPLTRGAVRKFQRSNKIQVTGMLDPTTRDRLAQILVKRAPSSPENLKVLEMKGE